MNPLSSKGINEMNELDCMRAIVLQGGVAGLTGKGINELNELDCLRIMTLRSSGPPPFSPASIAGCVLWLNAGTVAGADGDQVAAWADGSGAGNNAAQATSNNQPLLKKGANGINGQNVLRFDGSNDRLLIATAMTIRRAFFVVKYGASGNFPDFAAVISGQNTIPGLMGEGGTSKWYEAGDVIYRVDGVQTFEDAPIDTAHTVSVLGTSDFTETGWQVSGDRVFGRQWLGDIAEIIGYNVALSAGDVLILEAYLKAKYATP